MTPTLADLVMALNRERARTARLRTLLARRNRTIDDLLDTLDQTQQELRATRGQRPSVQLHPKVYALDLLDKAEA